MTKTIRLNIIVTEEESEILKRYSVQKHRTQSDVMREFIRGLEQKLDNVSNKSAKK